jgi:hypothetical protein
MDVFGCRDCKYEYPNSAAYVYHRIMLIEVLQNDVAKAESTLTRLQTKSPVDSPGSYFNQAPSIFWKECQFSMGVQVPVIKLLSMPKTTKCQQNILEIRIMGCIAHDTQHNQFALSGKPYLNEQEI